MMDRFRKFLMSSKPVHFRLREDDMAPTPTADMPSNPDGGTTNKYHFDYLQQELGMDDDAFKGAMEGGVQTLYKIPEYGWGFRVQPPVQATVVDNGNDQYEVTFMLTQKKLTNPKSFVLPYKTGQRPVYYEGPVEDKTVMMNKEELADLVVPPYESGGMPGMGGMPPGGGAPGGAPPGGPLAGGMPPMGGM